MEQIKLLVVDDEQIVLDSIKKILRHDEKLTVTTALSVENALNLMDSFEPSIVLTDLMMPDIDGLEFLKLLKDKNHNIIVIMITGYATINTALQAMQNGAFDYLAKPFTRDELTKLIHRAVELVMAHQSVSESAETVIAEPDMGEVKKLTGIGENSWLMQQDDNSVLIGVERPFLLTIGRIQTVYLPSKGDEVRQGSVYFQVFSADMRSLSVLSPLTGIVVEVNEKVLADPNKTLQDPYNEGWLIRIIPSYFNEERQILGL